MKQGIIWDLDGTMWDSSLQVYQAWNAYMQAHGQSRRFSRDDVRGYCGKTIEEIAAVVFPQADENWRVEMITGCCDWENVPLAEHGGELFDGLLPVLEQLHGQYHMSVVSNCGLGYIEAFFQGNQTGQYFDDYENAARTGLGKAENIRLVMQRNGLDRAVYIGDTSGDFAAAAAAGVPFVHAAYGYGQVPQAVWRIERLAQLPPLIAQLLPVGQVVQNQ